MKEKYLYNYSFDEFVKTIKHYCNLLYLSKNLIVFKYMISILTILLLHTNNLYAQAKRTDTVSVTQSSIDSTCEASCLNKYVYSGFSREKVGYCWNKNDREYYSRFDPEYPCEGFTKKDEASIAFIVPSMEVCLWRKGIDCGHGDVNIYHSLYIYEKIYCNFFSGEKIKINKLGEFQLPRYCPDEDIIDVFTSQYGNFFTHCYTENYSEKYDYNIKAGYRRHYLRLNIGSALNYIINDKCSMERSRLVKECIEKKCSKKGGGLMIGNKEIKTVGDLLDSIPATELLKVYDPNMVNN